MNIRINRKEKTPIYLQISSQIKKLIFSGTLVDGYAMPSERNLAKQLEVHRNTIVRAYSELRDEGLLISYQGQGYRVSYGRRFYGMIKKPVNWQGLMKERYARVESDFDDLFSKSYDARNISFGGGMAAKEPYSAEEMASVFEKVLTEGRDKAYFYTPYQGNLELRKEIVTFLASKGISAGSGNLQIFSENNQALDFLMTLMLSNGDRVITAETLSPDVYRTIQMAGGEIVTVPVDENGLMCDELEAVIQKEDPQFIYVDSSFHNPTGAVLSVERREKLLTLSYKYRIPIIEEDQGSELYYDIGEIPSIKSMDTGNNVIYMYSCSLTMMPGIGISFVLADREVIQRLSKMVSMRVAALDWTPQMLLLEYMKRGLFKERLEVFRSICRKKRDLMYGYIEKLSEEMDVVCRKPEGGVFLWIRLPDGMDGRILLKEVEKEGVTFIPGYVFYLKKGMGKNYIRLNYSYPSEDEIVRGMDLLSRTMKQMHQENSDKMR